MARKTLPIDTTDEAVEEFKSLSIIKQQVAQEVYDEQDADTKAAIDKTVKVLEQYSTGCIKIDGNAVAVQPKYVSYSLFYLAVEIAKDLSFMGIQLSNFQTPLDACAICGDSVA